MKAKPDRIKTELFLTQIKSKSSHYLHQLKVASKRIKPFKLITDIHSIIIKSMKIKRNVGNKYFTIFRDVRTEVNKRISLIFIKFIFCGI